MKILAVAYSGVISGGANRSLLMVLKNLRDIYGHEVEVVLPGTGSLTDALDEENIPWFLANYAGLNAPKPHGITDILRYGAMFYKSVKFSREASKVAKKVKSKNFDIIYTTEIFNFFGIYLARHLGLPHVWHFRSASENYLYPPNAPKTFANMDGKIIVISNYLEDYMNKTHKIPHDKMVMISNGLDLKDVPVSPQNREKGIHMVLCGRIVAAKGHMDALKALSILKNKGHRDLVLHFAGSIPNYETDSYYKSLLNFISENKLQDNVVFEGEVNDMVALREKMNIELMCSTAEAFGRVTVEGMHSGLVVIGSNTGGTLDIIVDGENGLLYKQGDGADLADKIEKVLEDADYADKLSRQAKAFSETHFTMEENIANINKVLMDCVK